MEVSAKSVGTSTEFRDNCGRWVATMQAWTPGGPGNLLIYCWDGERVNGAVAYTCHVWVQGEADAVKFLREN